MLSIILIILLGQAKSAATPVELIRAATTRPWPGESTPALPTVSTAMRDEIIGEISSSRTVRQAYEKLDASKRRNVEWFEGVAELEGEHAIWALLSCLVHPHDDVQSRALESLARIRDKRTVPFLLIYAEYMAVYVAGSEKATIHGMLHQRIARALSEITGVKVAIDDGQDPNGLRKGIRQWRKWENEHLTQ